ncbi:uncharacterized protein [Montipora capricornis]|uniref:uncharacterized protein n=1 Tax=Montipora capricornis TaxID=246305 RepID=UPI0035F18D63
MEMRNTEQLLASIGLIAHKIDSLRETNNALRCYGPESFHGDHITVKKKAEQQSADTRHNTCVSSMSGLTELEILRELVVIVEQALPLEKLKKTYKDLNTARDFILNRVTFCQTRVGYFEDALSSGQFVRDFGTSTEVINLEGSVVKGDMQERLKAWREEQQHLSEIFRKLCQCRKKTLSKGNEDIIEAVAKKQGLQRVEGDCYGYSVKGIQRDRARGN